MDIRPLTSKITSLLFALSLNVANAADVADSEIVSFSPGGTAVSAEINSNFNVLKNAINSKQDKIIAGDCGAGFAIRKVNPDGSVLCEKVAVTGGGGGPTTAGVAGVIGIEGIISNVDNTNVVTIKLDNPVINQTAVAAIKANDGAGSTLDADFLDGKNSSDFAASSQGCLSGQAITSVDATGGVVCDPVITGVVPGNGLQGGGSIGSVAVSIDPTKTQARVTGTCGPNASIRTINQDGTVACEIDDGNGINGITAGAFLSGGGTTGVLKFDVVGMPTMVYAQGVNLNTAPYAHLLTINAPTAGFLMVTSIGRGSCGDGYGGFGPMSVTLRHTGTGTTSPTFSFTRSARVFSEGLYSINYVFPAVQGSNTIELKSTGVGFESCLPITIINASVLFVPG